MQVIAIDGPAAAGKGTLARKLAATLNYAYLDTGALYRAVALAMLRAGHDPSDAARAGQFAAALDPQLLNDPALRDEAVGKAAAVVADFPSVRANLLEWQRNFAKNPPAPAIGAVLDGRDIGTVICPDAPVKLFITASDETRAMRRWEELRAKEVAADFDKVLADLKARDEKDRARAAAPLKPASDAHLIDTTKMDIDAVFSQALDAVRQKLSTSTP